MQKNNFDESTMLKFDATNGKIVPSPDRVRNILTLEERIKAIKAYENNPMYTRVAKMFSCSWEQIKNIIANRKAILDYYAATKRSQLDPMDLKRRKMKLEFLGECVYEYIQRVQFHTKYDITENLIRDKAMEFRNIIEIDNFVPNKAWMNHFKANYNFSISNRKIMLTRQPPASMDVRDIMTYCTTAVLKNRSSDMLLPTSAATTQPMRLHNTSYHIEEEIQRRQRKVIFLEKALAEYIRRAQYHHKVMPNDFHVTQIATKLMVILKIEKFTPNSNWLQKFRQESLNKSNESKYSAAPPLSLQLQDVLSYVGRHEKIHQNVNLLPKQHATSQVEHTYGTKATQAAENAAKIEVIEITEDDEEEDQHIDLQPQPVMKHQAPTLKIRNIESLQNPKHDAAKRLLQDDEDNYNALQHQQDVDNQPPALKIRRIESMQEPINNAPVQQTETSRNNSPEHWFEEGAEENEELPRQVCCYSDALKLLKPLEEFAMLEENYRAIGLLTQLEELFKNPPNKDDIH